MSADATAPLASLLAQYEARLSALESQLGVAPPPAGASAAPAAAAAGGAGDNAMLAAYDAYVAEFVAPFVATCGRIGGPVSQLGDITTRAFAAQRDFLDMASQSKQPAPTALAPLLAPIQTVLREASDAVTREPEVMNHQKTVSDGLACLGWLCGITTPKGYIEEYKGSAEFNSNKIRMEWKSKGDAGADHIAFAKGMSDLIVGLAAYAKAHHTCGVAWNAQGGEAFVPGGGAAPAPAPAAAAAAPAPAAASESKSDGGGVAMADVFAGIKSIDQSSGRTAGLRQVTKDQQTWRAEYKGSDAPAPAPAPRPRPTPRQAERPTGTPVCELRRDKWIVENQGGDEVVNVNDVTMRQQVYIYGCIGAQIVITGKPKNIAVDKCKRCKIICDNVLTSFEFVNCQRVQAQCTGSVPSVAIDKTDGCTFYISAAGVANTLFVTSKSSEMNIAFPGPGGEGDWLEQPIPEQFHSRVEGNSIITTVSDLYSG